MPPANQEHSEIDWRAAFVSTLAEDWHSPYTSNKYSAGTLVMAVTPGMDVRRRSLSFVSPSPPALALHLSATAAARAEGLRLLVSLRQSPDPVPTFAVLDEDLPALYDYLEACFVAVTFACESLESFVNGEIRRANPSVGFEVSRNGERTTITPDRLEVALTLDEKLGGLLPHLVGVPSPKGRQPWKGFRTIQAERNAVIHLKGDDASPRSWTRQSIFHRFWADGVTTHPASALAMIRWFFVGREQPRWLAPVGSMLAELGLPSSVRRPDWGGTDTAKPEAR